MHIVITAVVWVALSIGVGAAGKSFRFGFWGYFFASILLTPIMGLLLLAAAGPRRSR